MFNRFMNNPVFIPLMLCYLYFVYERSDMVIFQHLRSVLFFISVYLFSVFYVLQLPASEMASHMSSVKNVC
jgi:hypothetical protein